MSDGNQVVSTKRDWTDIVQELSHLVEKEDETVLHIGDILGEVEDTYGKKFVDEAAKACKISNSVARQRLWVSKRIPKDSDLRTSGLTYSHLRAVAGTSDIDDWGQKAIDNDWTVAQLKEEIDKAGDDTAKAEGKPCNYCEQPLPIDGEIVSIRIGAQRIQRYCGVECASLYLGNLVTKEENIVDQAFEESASVV